MARAVSVIVLFAAVALPSLLFWVAIGNDRLRAQQLDYQRQDECILPGSRVHSVYNSMLTSLRQELAQWDEFKLWSDTEMPALSASIDAHRQISAARLRELEAAPICARISW